MLKVTEGIRVAIVSQIIGEAVPYGSAAHQAAQQLQVERFNQIRSGRQRRTDEASYLELTEFEGEIRYPIVVWHTHSSASGEQRKLIATAQLQLPGAMLIERMIELHQASVASHLLSQGRVAEIGGFAAVNDLDKQTLITAIDAIVSIVIELARQQEIEWLWIFPRNGFMSLMEAEIPDLLPPYHFSLCPDVAGWKQNSPEVDRFRTHGLRGVSDEPLVYAILLSQLSQDLDARRLLLPRRANVAASLDRLLTGAMVRAQRIITAESRQVTRDDLQMAQTQADSDEASVLHATSFLPFDAESDDAAIYLHELHLLGGVPVKQYKALSYRLLDVQPGMRVLDVGCGSGDDLPDLARMVGENGVVVGLDRNRELVLKARELLDSRHVHNAMVFEGNAELMSFAAQEFDRVRADRAIQHMSSPAAALAEMWRVLRSGGKLTITEPDWSMMAVFPASASSNDDDTVFQQVLAWCRRHLAHPHIGRQLLALLRHVSGNAWSEVRVDVQTFTYTSWPECDAVLRLSRAADMVTQEIPSLSDAIHGWLAATQAASARGEFFAAMPLFFAYATRAQE